MNRRVFLGVFSGTLLVAPPASRGQSPARLPVVGVLINNVVRNVSLMTLLQGLRDLGYVEERNLVVVVKSADGNPAALPALATELVRAKVDVIYATGPAAIKAAIGATHVIPIVALDLETDPVKAGWVRTLSRPGGNLTGLFLDIPGLASKWLELLSSAAPAARHIAVVWDSTTGSAQLEAAKAAAPRFGVHLQVLEIRSAVDLGASIGEAVSARAEAMIFFSSPLVSTEFAQLAKRVAEHRIPAISPFRRFAEAGGLMSYGPDFDAFRQSSAAFVDMILKGTKAGDLPIQQPKTFEMVINLKSATDLGLKLPQSLLVLADRIIQ
jgi:putative ABC transport system substrate-binding protein